MMERWDGFVRGGSHPGKAEEEEERQLAAQM